MTAIVLAPIDITDIETTKKVFEAAVAQTKALEADLYVMTVVPDIVSGLDWRYAIRGETGGSAEFDMSKVVSECLEKLNQIVSEHTPAGMTVKTIVRHGSVYEQVLDVAEEIKADQIVMGAHRPGLGDFLLGPNTARIVRHATCSVNVIRI
ncbi:universal stress protein [Denitrobaculum tricleocarpae]|uniref:Universal stress protein n=1 Tax=Denitrobaculum tricleocarpae TaxID=2591009 RepID=A0A545TT55_9PROT|nr:universal stress protein [Denitrobaculum tricleocarpae]TQV80396.1 universal stress protein [Denitrobaculum tricleocarpae]